MTTISLTSSVNMSFLKVDGTRIVDASGNEVVLHGAGLGGWMTLVHSSSPPPLVFPVNMILGWRILSQVHLTRFC